MNEKWGHSVQSGSILFYYPTTQQRPFNDESKKFGEVKMFWLIRWKKLDKAPMVLFSEYNKSSMIAPDLTGPD